MPIVVLAVFVWAAPTPGRTSEPTVEAAIKALDAARTDPDRLQQYCTVSITLAEIHATSTPAALESEIEKALAPLPPELGAALRIEDELNPDTPEGDAYMRALHALGESCPKHSDDEGSAE